MALSGKNKQKLDMSGSNDLCEMAKTLVNDTSNRTTRPLSRKHVSEVGWLEFLFKISCMVIDQKLEMFLQNRNCCSMLDSSNV